MTSEPIPAPSEDDKRDLTHRRWRIASFITYALFLVLLVPWTFQPHTIVLDTLFWSAFTISLAVGFVAEILPDRTRRTE